MDGVTDSPVRTTSATETPWWRDAVIYQIYPRSWADSNGDGLGDLPGITERLAYLKDLGVDAVWLSPFYRSPMADAGYDVADYRDIDPIFGTLEDADALLARAKELGLRVVVDLVPNHTSDEHVWFQAALAAAPGSPERERYIFRDGKGVDGAEPPNNWQSVFYGDGWSQVPDGQWYLHLFDTKQPDLNWDNPQVREEFHDILRFWLDRGVDGFRVDVAHGLVKEPGLPDYAGPMHLLGEHGEDEVVPEPSADHPVAPMWDQDGVHDIYRGWRSVLNGYSDRDPILCAEAWVEPAERLARYLRPDEMHQAFNFEFLETHWRGAELTKVITDSIAAEEISGTPSTWVLSNHDVVRHSTRLGYPPVGKRPNGIGAEDPQPDTALGLRRARAATLLMLALPGGAYLYQGEELGLPEHTTMPDKVRQDPTYHRTAGAILGRDGCRVPMPWAKDAPSFGFGPSEQTWLPQPEAYGDYAVDQQDGVSGSTLEFYRSALRLRRELRLGLGTVSWLTGHPAEVVAFRVASGDSAVQVLANTDSTDVPLPEGAEVLLASGDLVDGRLPSDTTVWLRD
ncbi:glycoside hydrolase family 13 protein [Actinomycetota bacterium]